MASTSNGSLRHLSITELEWLVELIIDKWGADLSRQQFTEMTMELLDQIPGLEMLSSEATKQYVSDIWTRYLSVQREASSG